MFLELAEILDCPVCRDGFGLVAFVRQTERRRVLSGRLGCPICEVEFPIARGVIDFALRDGADTRSDADVAPVDDRGDREGRDTDLAVRLAALLGLGDRPGLAVLLGPGLGWAGAAVASLAERVEVISVCGPSDRVAWSLEDLAEGADPVIGIGERWPVRAGALDGVALRGPSGTHVDEAARCLRTGGRLVVIAPPGEREAALDEARLEPIASDADTWVGVRK